MNGPACLSLAGIFLVETGLRFGDGEKSWHPKASFGLPAEDRCHTRIPGA